MMPPDSITILLCTAAIITFDRFRKRNTEPTHQAQSQPSAPVDKVPQRRRLRGNVPPPAA